MTECVTTLVAPVIRTVVTEVQCWPVETGSLSPGVGSRLHDGGGFSWIDLRNALQHSWVELLCPAVAHLAERGAEQVSLLPLPLACASLTCSEAPGCTSEEALLPFTKPLPQPPARADKEGRGPEPCTQETAPVASDSPSPQCHGQSYKPHLLPQLSTTPHKSY